MTRIRGLRRAIARLLPAPIRARVRRAVGRGSARTSVLAAPTAPYVPFAVDAELAARPRLNILLPHLEVARLTGGPNTALQVAASLAASGIDLRFIATSGPADRDPRGLVDHIRALSGIDLGERAIEVAAMTGSRDGPDQTGSIRIGSRDVFMATWWRTAPIAASVLAATEADAFLYLVQDFEPAFYPWSSSYAEAMSTYSLPCRPIVNTRLLARYLEREIGGVFATTEGDRWIAFEPAVDPDVFAPRPGTGDRPESRVRSEPQTRPRLLFYARPRNERNLYDTGIAALADVARTGALDGWDVRSIGSRVAPVRLSANVVLEPQTWLGYREYGELLARSAILVSLMLSPHPSYPPLEMAATGGLVVTNSFAVKTAAALGAMSDRFRVADPSVASIAAAVRAAVAEAEGDLGARVRAISLPGSWTEALAEVTPWATAVVAELSGRGEGTRAD